MLKHLPSFPNALLYLPSGQGGAGLQRFSSICQLEKLRLLTRLHEGDIPCVLAAHSISHRAAARNGLQLLPQQGGTMRYNTLQVASFLRSCIQWCELQKSPMCKALPSNNSRTVGMQYPMQAGFTSPPSQCSHSVTSERGVTVTTDQLVGSGTWMKNYSTPQK